MKFRKIIVNNDSQLLGDSFTNDTSGSYNDLGKFKLETNFTGKINTNYENVLTTFSNPITLENLNITIDNSKKILEKNDVILNIDRSDLKSYIKYGNTTDYIKTAIKNIISSYPGSLFVDNEMDTNIYNIVDYYPNVYINKSSFKIDVQYIKNKFALIYKNGNNNIPDDEIKNMNLYYDRYVLLFNNVEYNIVDFIGEINGYISVEVDGVPFGNNMLNLFSCRCHLKPKPIYFNKYRKEIDPLERYMLSNRTENGFKFQIKKPSISEDGDITYVENMFVWPTTDGYNIDYEQATFNMFLDNIMSTAYNYDTFKTDIICRMLQPNTLRLYDTTNDNKIEKLLKIWGRNFDEIKQYIDALSRINKLSYDKKNNIPDVLVKNMAKSFGWSDISLVSDDDLISNFFSSEYEEQSEDMLPAEIDIELWRRILINTNYFWKTKGTRNSIISMLRLIGIPEPFINVKEYIYTVDGIINPEAMELEIGDFFSNEFPFNNNGYPISPEENKDFWFQMNGNNDNGQTYINNFRKAGFSLNIVEDNKKSWTYEGEIIREHDTTVNYYQSSSDLIINTKQIDISLDIANAMEYDVFDYIKNVDYPNNSPEFTKKYTFINIKTEYQNNSRIQLAHEPVGDVQISINGVVANNGFYYVDGLDIVFNDGHELSVDDVIIVSYLHNGINDELENIIIKFAICVVESNDDGSIIQIPDNPNGDIQLMVNGITYSKNTDTFIGEYILNPNNSKEIIILNQTLREMLIDGMLVQVSYITTETNYDLKQKSEFHKIINYYGDKFYFDVNIYRYVYKLDYNINNINDVRITLNGITLSPETEYQLSTVNKKLILLPSILTIGDVLGFYYVISDTGSNDITIPNEFGVGDISKLSFLEFIDLLEKKMINVKNRKIITDNKGGFYPTLLKIYVQYLKRSNLPDDNILKSNGYVYDDLYSFLNKYNSLFYKFTEQLLPATIIHDKSGFLIRNSVFTKQKYKYKRGVSLNIDDNDIGIPNNDLKWLGTDGSEFRVLQKGSILPPETILTLMVDTINTYYYMNKNCYSAKITIGTTENISNKILVLCKIVFIDNTEEYIEIILDNINSAYQEMNGLYIKPKSIQIISYTNIIGVEDYLKDTSVVNFNYNNNLNIQPDFQDINIYSCTITKLSTGLVDIAIELTDYFDGLDFKICVISNDGVTQDEYILLSDFERGIGNFFYGYNLPSNYILVDTNNDGIIDGQDDEGQIYLKERLDSNIISCDIKYFTSQFKEFVTYIPYIEPPIEVDRVGILYDDVYPYYYNDMRCKATSFKLWNINNTTFDSPSGYSVVYRIRCGNEDIVKTINTPLNDFNIVYTDHIESYIDNPTTIKLLTVIDNSTNQPISFDNLTYYIDHNTNEDIAPLPDLENYIVLGEIFNTTENEYIIDLTFNAPLLVPIEAEYEISYEPPWGLITNSVLISDSEYIGNNKYRIVIGRMVPPGVVSAGIYINIPYTQYTTCERIITIQQQNYAIYN